MALQAGAWQHGALRLDVVPVVGGFFVLGAGALMPESGVTGGFLLLLYALDTGGVPWFFVWTLRTGFRAKQEISLEPLQEQA